MSRSGTGLGRALAGALLSSLLLLLVAPPSAAQDDGDPCSDGSDCNSGVCSTNTNTCVACPATDLGSDLPTSTSGSTSGNENNLSGSCGGESAGEATLQYTAPVDGTYNINTCGSSY